MLVITAIGNPEPEYRNTRHNVGLLVLDQWLIQNQLTQVLNDLAKSRGGEPSCVELDHCCVVRSANSYMNLSGGAVGPVWQRLQRKYGVLKHVVIHDELTVSMGHIKWRVGGSRGHNGIKSLPSHNMPKAMKGYTMWDKNFTGQAEQWIKNDQVPMSLLSIGIAPSSEEHYSKATPRPTYVLGRLSNREHQLLLSMAVPKVFTVLKKVLH